MQTHIFLFILLTVLTASVFAGGSGEVHAQTVINDNHTSVQTSITSRSNTGGNSTFGGHGASGVDGAYGTSGTDGEDGQDGAPGVSSQGTSRSYVEIRSVVDGEVVVDERHEATGEAGESVSIDVQSDVVNGEARTSHSITVGDQTQSTSNEQSTRQSASVAQAISSTDTDVEAHATTTITSEEASEDEDIDSDESASRSPWTFITGLFTKFFTYVGSFFS